MQKNAELRWKTTQLLKMNWSRSLFLVFAIAGAIPPLVFRAIDWYHDRPLSYGWDFAQSILISVLTTLTISIGVVSVINWLQKKYPWNEGVFIRLFLEISLTTATSLFLITAITVLTHITFLPKKNLQESIFNYMIVALIMNFVLVAITEGIFFFKKWKNSAVEAERFKKESIQAQFQSLKNQVNPHFLFNSLNTLSSLIDYDKDLSKEFLDDLSTVYRYVLQHKDEEIVHLQTEVNFIHSFVRLLKKRHGHSVSFHFNILQQDLQKGVPPMTLQLLVENAIKHNIASRKKPLTVEIFSQDQMLVIRNNWQPKKEGVVSTGVGLKNVSSRYSYLINRDIQVQQDDQHYQIHIPLIIFS